MIRTTDPKARVRLPKDFADAAVLIERISDTELRLSKVLVLPAGELRFREEAPTVLSDRDRDLFLELLENPPPPNEALRNAARREYRPPSEGR